MSNSQIANAEGFPWGANKPTRIQRLVFALSIAAFCAAFLSIKYDRFPHTRSDFSQARFGAEAIVHGANPYVLSGPGRTFDNPRPVLYPATAFVAAIPFLLVSDHAAAVIFVTLSAFLLAYGATAKSWHLVAMFPSIAFLSSIQFAQWSPLMTAAVFLPWLAFFGAIKPQSILPVALSSERWTQTVVALVGGILLLGLSIFLYPDWPREWLSAVSGNRDLTPPLFRLGGPVILLALLRWRRPEAWLVALSACMPQTWGWYNTLVLLTVAGTYREACVLSLVSSAGQLLALYFSGFSSQPESYGLWGAAMVAFAYLPATIVVLRHGNEGNPPAVIRFLVRRSPRNR